MGAFDAPQWLIAAWQRSVAGAGATADPGAIRAVGEALLDRWSQPDRHFHNLRHLADVLARVDELASETHEPELVRLAAWYHGAIFTSAEKASYANRGGEDEQASAVLAREELTALGLPPASVERVVTLVTALTRHQPRPDDFDCAVLCDADLSVLAGDPQRYKTYLSEIRAEYAHLPVEAFVRARIAILRKLDQRPTLFSSPLGAAWEEPARQNLGAELQRLEKELAKIEAARASETPEVAPEPAAGGQAAGTPAPEPEPTAPDIQPFVEPVIPPPTGRAGGGSSAARLR
ncbi:hypothetical protein [Actinotalea sp.]|uniref:HD domain-containing protein n=1 Tax=Actinotalea sp. TaxID=1872145 RepID=UPI003561C0EE